MTDFFLRNEDEKLAENATHLDDIDLVPSTQGFTGPWGASLVVVAMKHGAHVCWKCGGFFDESKPEHKRQEIKHGETHILLHRGCVGGQRLTSYRGFDDTIRGLQARRFMAKATQPLATIANEAGGSAADSPLIVLPK